MLNDSLEGALYGALLTFNLIGGYNYYIKIKEWENVKPVVSSNIQDFISSYRVYMQGHRFPVKHHFLLSEHFTKDTLIESKILKDQSKSFNEKLSDAYSEYEELFSDMLQKSNEIEMDEDQLKKYIEFLVSAENKINQSIIVSIAIFDDKIDLVIELQKLYNLIHRFLMYYNFSAYQHSNNFIEDCLRIIKQNKNVLELLD
ncbi:MAG: hypothetical protein HN887_06870 [Campylobacteraceae bacterium]|nr:hypothetical protein [Campylobacteraceae bacterium]